MLRTKPAGVEMGADFQAEVTRPLSAGAFFRKRKTKCAKNVKRNWKKTQTFRFR
jgi:hypothetical protein